MALWNLSSSLVPFISTDDIELLRCDLSSIIDLHMSDIEVDGADNKALTFRLFSLKVPQKQTSQQIAVLEGIESCKKWLWESLNRMWSNKAIEQSKDGNRYVVQFTQSRSRLTSLLKNPLNTDWKIPKLVYNISLWSQSVQSVQETQSMLKLSPMISRESQESKKKLRWLWAGIVSLVNS